MRPAGGGFPTSRHAVTAHGRENARCGDNLEFGFAQVNAGIVGRTSAVDQRREPPAHAGSSRGLGVVSYAGSRSSGGESHAGTGTVGGREAGRVPGSANKLAFQRVLLPKLRAKRQMVVPEFWPLKVTSSAAVTGQREGFIVRRRMRTQQCDHTLRQPSEMQVPRRQLHGGGSLQTGRPTMQLPPHARSGCSGGGGRFGRGAAGRSRQGRHDRETRRTNRRNGRHPRWRSRGRVRSARSCR